MSMYAMPVRYVKHATAVKLISYGMILFAGFLCLSDRLVFADMQYGDVPQGQDTTVVYDDSISGRERASLSKQYQFDVRGKDQLLVPNTGSTANPVYESSESMTEGEKYRHYFGAAIDMHRSGWLEESAKILRYLSEIDPNDDYVRSYLARVQKEIVSNGAHWKNEAASKAYSIRNENIKTFLREGEAFFNNKDFDNALIRFHDLLAMDPNNSKALSYMKKLKAFYPKRLEIEEIASNWEMGKTSGTGNEVSWTLKHPSSPIETLADRLLDESSTPSKNTAIAIRDKARIEQLVLEKRAEELLGEVAFGSEIEAIIANKRAEETRATQMMLGAGDVLRISVLSHPEFSGEMTVQSNGAVTIPLTGDEIEANGFTIDELKEKAVRVISKYVDDPTISVYMLSGKSQIFYVIDEVSCTPYPITRTDLTLRDALFLSDWGDNRALGRVIVIKPSANKPIIRKVDAFNIIYRGDLKDNIRIANGDVIYVPITMMAKVTKGIYDSIAPFRAVRVARDEFLAEKWNKRDFKDYFRMPEIYDEESQSAKNVDNSYNAPQIYVNR